MDTSPEPTQAAPHARGRKKWARRCVRAASCLAALAVCLVFAIGFALWWLIAHPTDAVRMGIGMFAADSGIEVEEVELTGRGSARLRGITLSSGEGEESIRLDTVNVGYSGVGIHLLREGRIDSLEVTGGKLRIDDQLLARLSADRGTTDLKPDAEEMEEGAKPWWLERILPDAVTITELAVSVDLPGVPRLVGDVDFETGAFADLVAGASSGVREVVRLRDGAWVAEGKDRPVAFDELEIRFGVGGGFEKVSIDLFEVTGLRADLSKEGLAEYLEGRDQSGGGEKLPEIEIAKMRAKDARLSFAGESLPAIDAEADFEVSGLVVAGGRLRSAAEQSLVLRKTEVRAPGADGDPLVRWEDAELRAVPDDLLDHGVVSKLRIAGLEVNVSEATIGEMMDVISQRGSGADGEDGRDGDDGTSPSWRVPRVSDLRIDGAALAFDPAGWMRGLPAASAKLAMRAEGETAAGEMRYGLELSELEVRETAGSAKPFATGAQVTASFRSGALQDEGVIDEVAIRGVRAEIGDQVANLAEESAESAAEKDEDASDVVDEDDEGGPRLTISKFSVGDATFTLRDLIPGTLPHLTIGIDTELEGVPLLGRSQEDEHEQRIELRGVHLVSPYNPLQNVAELKSVWVYFTIPGLFRNEIKRVEIVSPDLYIGEPLFWYIDYARKYAAGETTTDAAEAAAGPEGEPGAEGGAGDAIVEGLKTFQISGWRVGEVAAHSGRIIVAPTGVPLGIVPFPFDARTDFAEGEIELKVQVPSGDYTFERLKLELQRLAGEAYVNYPVASDNNNFVQTFQSPLVKFQKYEGTDMWLSVTYDQGGIYGELGGETYGGYAKGGFNIYVDGPFRWDAWVSGTGLELDAFTKVLAPDSFLMSGLIDGQVVAEGREFELHKASAEVSVRDGGSMRVLSLDKVKASLPDDWDPIWRALTEAGIDTLRDYRFDVGECDVVYDAGKGSAQLFFDGDDGKRDIRVRLFDRRTKAEAAAVSP